jgi:hypothetical protein
MVAIARLDEFSVIELPPAQTLEAKMVPVIPRCLIKLFPARINVPAPVRSIEAVFALRKRDCENREVNQKGRVTWIKDETGVKSAIWVVEKSNAEKNNLGVSKCEDQPAEATAGEVEMEILRTDSATPRAAEESKASSFSAPLAKCSKDPQ